MGSFFLHISQLLIELSPKFAAPIATWDTHPECVCRRILRKTEDAEVDPSQEKRREIAVFVKEVSMHRREISTDVAEGGRHPATLHDESAAAGPHYQTQPGKSASRSVVHQQCLPPSTPGLTKYLKVLFMFPETAPGWRNQDCQILTIRMMNTV
jgi:hypothetical protein